MSICIIDYLNGKRTPFSYCIGICLTCFNNLVENKNDQKMKNLCKHLKLCYEQCLCQEKDATLILRVNLSVNYIIKHYQNNKEIYLKKLNTVNNLILEEEEKIKKILNTNPREIWLEKTKDLSFDIEDEFDGWLKIYIVSRKKRHDNLKYELNNFRLNKLIELNILIYDKLNI